MATAMAAEPRLPWAERWQTLGSSRATCAREGALGRQGTADTVEQGKSVLRGWACTPVVAWGTP